MAKKLQLKRFIVINYCLKDCVLSTMQNIKLQKKIIQIAVLLT